MKKHITVAALLAAGSMFANADVISLDPAGSGTTGQNAEGIAAEDVWGYGLKAWHGTWENQHLANQVSFSEDSLSLQIGAASDGAGNFAAVKFAMDAAGTATLTFDYEYASTWGSAQNLVVNYVCTVYGFTEEGTSVQLASETFIDGVTVRDIVVDQTVNNVSLSFASDVSYAAYGVIFNAREAGGSNGGVAVSIDNVQVSYSAIPEPSAFGLLAGLGALALVASRRRRK